MFSTVDSYEKVDEVIRWAKEAMGLSSMNRMSTNSDFRPKIVDQPNIALFIGMGMGKTIHNVGRINELMYRRFAVNRVLVIAPKKVAEATWQAEGQKVGWILRAFRFSTVLGTPKQREAALATPADIYVTNRDNTAWLVDRYGTKWPFDCVVLDESSSFKSHQAQRWKKLKAVRKYINRVIELTGTPASQGLFGFVAPSVSTGWWAATWKDHHHQLPDFSLYRTRGIERRYFHGNCGGWGPRNRSMGCWPTCVSVCGLRIILRAAGFG